jgi:hypothetical protein
MDASNRKYTAVHDTIVKQALDSAKNKQHEKGQCGSGCLTLSGRT